MAVRGAHRPFVLSQHGCGRATAYSEFNKIVSIGSKTHVSWLDSQDGKFFVKARTLDRTTGTWSPGYTVGEAYDNHGGPSLACDNAGHLHVVYYPHHHPFRYRRSLRPNDASAWAQEEQFGEKCTYSSMICMPDDRLVLLCRESSDKRWMLNIYDKPQDSPWQGPRTLLHGNAPSGYTRWQASLALAPDGETIHTSFMLYEQKLGDVGYAIGYLRSRDGGQTWERSDGQAVALPATPRTIEIVDGSAVPNGEVNFRPGNIAVDRMGVPWIVYSRLDRQPYQAWIATLTSDCTWRKISVLAAIQQKWKTRGVKTPGCITFDKRGVMYVAATTVRSDVASGDAMWGHSSAEVAVLVSEDAGATFEVFEVSEPDASVPNWLPNLQRPTRHQPVDVPSLIYTHGHRGKTNRQIMSNEVVWCDLRDLVGQQP
jgi:hypothetical protein